MIVGIDARTYELDMNKILWIRDYIQGYIERNPKNVYHIFVTSHLFTLLPKGKNIHIIQTKSGMHNMLQEFSISKYLYQEKIESFISFENPIPRIVAKRSILILNHLTPIFYPNRNERSVFHRYLTKKRLLTMIERAKKILVPHTSIRHDITEICNVSDEKILVSSPFRNEVRSIHSTAIYNKISLQFNILSWYFLYDGWWGAHMNLIRMIRAYKWYIDKNSSPLDLVILGRENEDYKDIRTLISTLWLQKYIHILGILGEEETITLYENAKGYLCTPLYLWWHPLLERINQYNLPSVLSDLSVIRESIKARDNVFYIKPNKEETIIQWIEECHTSIFSEKIQKKDTEKHFKNENNSNLDTLKKIAWETCKRA